MKHILLFTAVLVFASCSDGESSFSPLDGYHSLEQIGCYCPTVELTPHQQQWSFDCDNMEIDVQTFGDIGATTPWLDVILTTGVYPFALQEAQVVVTGDTIDILELDGMQYGFFLEGRTITLDAGAPYGTIDANIYEFEQN